MLEETAMGDKPWQLTGEVSAGKRPHNSLLSASLDFESATMPSVEPTQALVEEIEAMIKKRIADGVYDDVIRREAVAPKGVPRNPEELEFEKSEKGLGELYANDYAKAVLGATEVKEADSIKKELQQLWTDLSRRLDALSNFHFTPKPIVKDAAVVANTAAISLEEVTPVGVSSSGTLAPEQLHGKKKREDDHMGDGDVNRDERKRRRAKRKRIVKRRRKTPSAWPSACLSAPFAWVARQKAR